MTTARYLGKDAKLYYNSASYDSPTWVEITNVRDAKVPAEKKEADASTRGTGGVELAVGTFIATSVEFNMNHDPGDAGWLALSASFYGFSPVELLVLDKDKALSGARGWRASYEVMKFDDGQPLKDIQTTDVMVKPTIPSVTTHFPERVTF